MTEELITPENLSTSLLKEVFDQAFMEAVLDNEGHLKVVDRVKAHIRPREDRIYVFAVFGFKPETPPARRLEFVNRVNQEYIIVRATSNDNHLLLFDHDIPVAGGITKKALVLRVKRFCSIPQAAIQEFGMDIVE